MDRNTQNQISKMINDVEDMATRYFAEDRSGEPFMLDFCLGDESLDHSRRVGEGARLGLHDFFDPSRVTVTVSESGYSFRIEHP